MDDLKTKSETQLVSAYTNKNAEANRLESEIEELTKRIETLESDCYEIENELRDRFNYEQVKLFRFGPDTIVVVTRNGQSLHIVENPEVIIDPIYQ